MVILPDFISALTVLTPAQCHHGRWVSFFCLMKGVFLLSPTGGRSHIMPLEETKEGMEERKGRTIPCLIVTGF